MSLLDAFLPSPRVRQVARLDVDAPIEATHRALSRAFRQEQLLYEEPERVIVTGAIRRFWEHGLPSVIVDPDRFASYDAPGFGKLVRELVLVPLPGGRTRVIAEQRLDATDDATWRRFRRHALMRHASLGRLLRRATRAAQNDNAPMPQRSMSALHVDWA